MEGGVWRQWTDLWRVGYGGNGLTYGGWGTQDAHPLIIIVGALRDTKDSCAETIREKNEQLQALLDSTNSTVLYPQKL